MPAGFRIAEAYVAVVPKDEGFESDLRAMLEAATARVTAEVGLGLKDTAPEDLKGDLDAALLLVTDGVHADVGMGLRNDAVGELDADVKAGVKLVEDDNKIQVKVDPKSANDAQQAGMSIGMKLALGVSTFFGPGVLVEAAVAGVPLMLSAVGVALAARTPEVQRSLATFKADVGQEMTSAVGPLVPAAQDAISQLDTLFRNETPRLGEYFLQARPDLDILTGGITSLITNVLPGFDAVMNQSQGASAAFAKGLGLAGDGVAHLLEGLAGGETGGAQGFVALMTLVDHVLGIIGTDLGKLANAAGPVAAELEPVLSAVVGDLSGMSTNAIVTGLGLVNSILSSLPVDVVRAIADATAAWYVASKVYGTLAGLGPAALKAGSALGIFATAEGATAKETAAMQASLGKALGAIGLVVTGAALLGNELGKVSGVGDHTAANVDDLTSSMIRAATGSSSAQNQLNQFALSMVAVSGVTGGTTDGMKSLDDALVKLFQLNPQQAATEYRELAAALENQGVSADQVAKDLPGYTSAVKDAALAAQEHATALSGTVPLVQQFTTATQDAINKVQGETTDLQSLTSAFDALDGVNISATQAQIQFLNTIDQLTLSVKQNGTSLDENTAKGRANLELITQLAQKADQDAEARYKQTGSIQDADAAFAKDRDALDATMKKLGFTTDQVNAMNKAFLQVPNIKPSVNTDPAMSQMAALDEFIMGEIADINNTPITPSVSGGAHGARATGGPVTAGRSYLMGEKGPEIYTVGANGFVTPNDKLTVLSGSSTASSSSGVTIQNLTITIPMTGFADFTDPNSMTIAARRMAVNISNALVQVGRSGTGAVNR